MKPMDDRAFRELCLAHALGALDAAGEAALFQALETADEARMLAFAEAVTEAAQGAPPPLPDPRVKADLLTRIETDANAPNRIQAVARGVPGSAETSRDLRPNPPKRHAPIFAYVAAAFGLVMAAVAGRQWHRAFEAQNGLRDSEARIEFLQDSLAAKQAMLAVLQARNLRMADLVPPAAPATTPHTHSLHDHAGKAPDHPGVANAPDMAGSTARILWDAERQNGVMRVSDMPPAPAGQDYFLWIIVDDKADPCVNAGAFAVRAAAAGELYRFRSGADLSRFRILGFEITLEPKGAAHTHADGKPHLHPVGRTLLKSTAFL